MSWVIEYREKESEKSKRREFQREGTRYVGGLKRGGKYEVLVYFGDTGEVPSWNSAATYYADDKGRLGFIFHVDGTFAPLNQRSNDVT